MSIFGKIMGAIFGTKAEAAPAGGAGSAGGAAVPVVEVAPILDKAVARDHQIQLRAGVERPEEYLVSPGIGVSNDLMQHKAFP